MRVRSRLWAVLLMLAVVIATNIQNAYTALADRGGQPNQHASYPGQGAYHANDHSAFFSNGGDGGNGGDGDEEEGEVEGDDGGDDEEEEEGESE